MHHRRLGPLAVLPLVVGGLATLPAAVSPATATACDPSIVTLAHHAHPGRTHTAASAPVVTRRHRHAYAATARLTITSGSARVTLTQSVCPDGSGGVAASTTQSGSGRGVTTRVVSAKGPSARIARRALTSALARARRAVTRQASTSRGQRKGARRALAAARSAALAAAHRALYASDVVYLSKDAAGTYHVTSVPPAGSVTISKGPAGAIVLSVPAGTSSAHATTSACVRRAPAWPTSFVFDGGDLVAPVLQAAARQDSGDYTIVGAPEPDMEGRTDATAPAVTQVWRAGWHQDSPGVVTYRSGLDPAAPSAGSMECLLPDSGTSVPYTATLVGAHVGASIATGADGLAEVVGGVPVELR